MSNLTGREATAMHVNCDVDHFCLGLTDRVLTDIPDSKFPLPYFSNFMGLNVFKERYSSSEFSRQDQMDQQSYTSHASCLLEHRATKPAQNVPRPVICQRCTFLCSFPRPLYQRQTDSNWSKSTS